MQLTHNGEHSADLVETVPLETLESLLRFSTHQEILLGRAEEEGVSEACVHYTVRKTGETAGMVTISGVSLTPMDIHEGRAFDGIGPGAVKHAEQRYGEIRELLNYGGDLYTVVFSPTSGKVIADSRRQPLCPSLS